MKNSEHTGQFLTSDYSTKCFQVGNGRNVSMTNKWARRKVNRKRRKHLADDLEAQLMEEGDEESGTHRSIHKEWTEQCEVHRPGEQPEILSNQLKGSEGLEHKETPVPEERHGEPG